MLLWCHVFCVTIVLLHGRIGWHFIFQKTVKAAAAVLEGHLLVSAKQLRTDRFEHLSLHQSLAETSGFEARHFAGAKHHILHQIAEDGVHSVWAREAFGVNAQMPSTAAHLHLGLQGTDDVVPQLGGAEGPRETCQGTQRLEGKEVKTRWIPVLKCYDGLHTGPIINKRLKND